MRKKMSGLILCFALLFDFHFSAFAANQVDTMDIQAVLYEDGCLEFKENRHIYVKRRG